ncbi:MAG: Mrp/NBP35 family ATP-binding protein [Polyangiaceae bacterium]|nr:Mrp/NBP35 family ATP-binding protein [Polyangiaceae bacterium]
MIAKETLVENLKLALAGHATMHDALLLGADVTLDLSRMGDAARDEIADKARKVCTDGGYTNITVRFRDVPKGRERGADDILPEVDHVILVMSGKGGVGKSTTATNLAMALARSGFRVGLLDADIYGPSIPTMFGVTGRPVSFDGKMIEPLERFGVKLMSLGFLLEDAKQAVIWRGPMLHGALLQFMKDVHWGALDFLVMDLPPGTGDVALTLSQKARPTGAVMVTTPQAVATDDVYKSVSMCEKVNIPILGVVENMSFFIDSAGVRHELFGKGGGAAIAEFAKAPLLGQIPIDQSVREWGDKGTPVTQAAPFSPIARAFVEVGEKLLSVIDERMAETAGPVIDRSGGAGRKRLSVVKS